jgi:murein DD-endopeptidase MepM/ murein hydrolase activator NlpD
MTHYAKPSSSVMLIIFVVSVMVAGCALLGPGSQASEDVYGYQPMGAVLVPQATVASASADVWLEGAAFGARSAAKGVGDVLGKAAAAPTSSASLPSSIIPKDPKDSSVPLVPGDPSQVVMLNPDLALPYPLDNVVSTFGECRGVKKIHRGLDLGGVGPDAGLGTPIRSMTRGIVLEVGSPDTDPRRFGKWDLREGPAKRRGLELPRSREIPGYGKVNFFTRGRGWSKMGVMIEIKTVGGALDGYQIRYMHLGAVHPSLKAGDMVEVGQEIGLMGGTAVQESMPHVHIDMDTATGRRVDVAPHLGLPRDRRGPKRCKGRGSH